MAHIPLEGNQVLQRIADDYKYSRLRINNDRSRVLRNALRVRKIFHRMGSRLIGPQAGVSRPHSYCVQHSQHNPPARTRTKHIHTTTRENRFTATAPTTSAHSSSPKRYLTLHTTVPYCRSCTFIHMTEKRDKKTGAELMTTFRQHKHS